MSYKNSSREGQALVEIALMLPLFVLILVAIIDFALIFHVQTSVDAMCIRAARAGTVRINQIVGRDWFTPDTHVATQVVFDAFWDTLSPMTTKGNFAPNDPIIDVDGPDNDFKSLRVSATYVHHPFLGMFFPQGWETITLIRHADAKKE